MDLNLEDSVILGSKERVVKADPLCKKGEVKRWRCIHIPYAAPVFEFGQALAIDPVLQIGRSKG